MELYPKSEWPCLDHCKWLLSVGEKKSSKLEVWNYERAVPEADWTVKHIGKYVAAEQANKDYATKH